MDRIVDNRVMATENKNTTRRALMNATEINVGKKRSDVRRAACAGGRACNTAGGSSIFRGLYPKRLA
ncbi:MAG TPA: hypothetical protein DD856_13415, partial [Sulfobacillus sp.]|nr:hypothetical protein [Sulfobacillus sp.]